jgi:hypothetical protein
MPIRPSQYDSVFRRVLDSLASGGTISLSELLAHSDLPASTQTTRLKHLRNLIDEIPSLVTRVPGLYPRAGAILQLIEERHGRITEANLDASNLHAATFVREIARPIVSQFVADALRNHIVGDRIELSMSDMMVFLLDEFAEFSKGAGNGLVSIAGTLNEQILIRAMTNAGMEQPTHFTKTGTNSEGDLVVHSTARGRGNLSVEIKSYHARERLLRGLQDIRGDKVGIGFFKNASEFNVARTQTLLQSGVAAIYMPQDTLDNVSQQARDLQTNASSAFQSRLYRPIERFVSDMRWFNDAGELPHF